MNPHLCIVGAGTLGQSLALWALQRGIDVTLVASGPSRLPELRATMTRRWRELHDLGQVTTDVSPEPCLSASWNEGIPLGDWVLEALPENLPLKREAWQRVEALARPTASLLTASSALPLAMLSSDMRQGGRLAGFHPFVPPHARRLVEIILPHPPADGLRQGALALADRLGLEAILVKDGPGLAATRMGLLQGLEAMRLLDEGVVRTPREVDRLMTLGYGHPLGPLELSDRVGLDLRLAIATFLHETTGQERWRPPAILKKLVADGDLGRKSGQGFYRWNGGRREP